MFLVTTPGNCVTVRCNQGRSRTSFILLRCFHTPFTAPAKCNAAGAQLALGVTSAKSMVPPNTRLLIVVINIHWFIWYSMLGAINNNDKMK